MMKKTLNKRFKFIDPESIQIILLNIKISDLNKAPPPTNYYKKKTIIKISNHHQNIPDH